MKITLRELRTLVRESVRQHLKENEDKPGKSYMVTGPFIGATGPTYAGDSRYVDLVKDIKTEIKITGVNVLIGNRVQYMLVNNLVPL